MNTLVIKSYDYLINNSYDRILNGKNYDDKFKLYQLDFINEMIDYFELREEYEKCQILKNYKEKRFDHKKNYLLNDRIRN